MIHLFNKRTAPRMIKKILVSILALSLFSCNSGTEATGDTWIGGEIVNPKTNFIVLKRNGRLIDTVQLQDDNTFHYKFQNPETGLYSFSHNEYQMFLLEPGDSLMLRVNTMDFDESLHYSGEGAKENNFLIELFLENEKEVNALPRSYALSPIKFQKIIDSLEKAHQKKYQKFIAINDPSEAFRNIVEANYDYNRYMKKEMYTLVFRKNKERVEKVSFPKGFYDYHEKVNLADKELGAYYPYINFLDIYLDNLTYTTLNSPKIPHRNSFTLNYNKIKLIDSLVTNDSLKNLLMRRSVRRYLNTAKNADKEREMLALFKQLNSNKHYTSEIEELAQATIKLVPGEKVPHVRLVNTENVAKDIHEIIKKPSVLYFWSLESVQHYKDIHSKAAELAAKYPEYQFIGINTDTHFKKWLKAVNYLGYSAENEYQFDDVRYAEKSLALNSRNKTLIVDGDAVILESNTNLFNRKFEGQILGFLNR